MKRAFTLTEVLIAVAIVGIIAALVLPKAIESYQIKTMEYGFNREVQTIEDSINSLAVNENKADFFSTMMYMDTMPKDSSNSIYDNTAGLYMKKYLRTSKMCDNPKDCFADTYYQYNAGKSRSEYKPDYKGSCAILKNGMSICMIPQIGAADITGIIDLNGKKGPNVLDRDLRTFSIASKTRVGLNQDTEGVKRLDWDNIEGEEETPPPPPPPTNPCDEDMNSLACCEKRAITGSSDACCTYEDFKSHPSCQEDKCTVSGIVTVHLTDVYHISALGFQINSLKYDDGKKVSTDRLKLVVQGTTYQKSYVPRFTCNTGYLSAELKLDDTTLSRNGTWCQNLSNIPPYQARPYPYDYIATWTFGVYDVKVPCN